MFSILDGRRGYHSFRVTACFDWRADVECAVAAVSDDTRRSAANTCLFLDCGPRCVFSMKSVGGVRPKPVDLWGNAPDLSET